MSRYQFVSETDLPDHGNDADTPSGQAGDLSADAPSRHVGQQAEKLEAIGKLTGGVAHDFNNVLQTISGNLHLLRLEAKGNEKTEKRVSAALSAVERGAQLAARLLAFGQRQALRPAATDLNALFSASQQTLRHAAGEHATLDISVSPQLSAVQVDGVQLERMLVQLLDNARQALGDSGAIRVTATPLADGADSPPRPATLPSGHYAVIEVSDTGAGMAPEIVRQVFDPFFTTRPGGPGTGLGLSMVHGFVGQSGGAVELDSVPGQGTRVRLYLPCTPEAVVAPMRNPAVNKHTMDLAIHHPARQDTSTERPLILVVEDDASVRETVLALVRYLGYAALEAENPDEALTLLQQGARPQLLFSDVLMPGRLTSTELAEQAQAMLPDLKVLFTSGFTANALPGGNALASGVALLEKPYGQDDLARRLRGILGPGQTQEEDNQGHQANNKRTGNGRTPVM
ncbi:Sensory box histidine kinase/response regulator [plant metagenome]|uniref:Sensory box histidine kinase/response regulator n=1 Tax=plant metagenome TaxID=1297885 RepID=A0A484S9L4_9ZZZZ